MDELHQATVAIDSHYLALASDPFKVSEVGRVKCSLGKTEKRFRNDAAQKNPKQGSA